MASTSRSGARIATIVAIAVLALGAAGVGVYFAAGNLLRSTVSSSSNSCRIGAYDLDTEQASVAAQMVGEVTRFTPALPDRAAVLVLAAGLQESRLMNLPINEGDRDSVGVLQQRPSQGWGGGDAAKLNDVTEATREFLKVLVTHRDWKTATLAKAINDVQISIDGSYYTQWKNEATQLARALLGRVPAGVTCSFAAPTVVAKPAAVAALLRAQLPVNAPATSGRSIRVPGAGWQSAAWLVANADKLGIDTVAYAGRSWSRSGGWVDRPRHDTSAVVARMASL